MALLFTAVLTEFSTMKAVMKHIVQSGFEKFGLHISRNRSGWDFLFEALRASGFRPKHIVDVGVNHGLWTRTAIRYFPDAFYTLIEPQEWLRPSSEDILSRGNARWISAGVSDKSGTLPFRISYRDDASTFSYSDDDAEAMGLQKTINVPVVTLNEAVKNSSLPDMVKIDAEGYDLKAIAGASDLIGKTDIFILEATICAPKLENTLENVVSTMSGLGYRAVDIPAVNRSPKSGVAWLCDVAFLRNESRFLDTTYE